MRQSVASSLLLIIFVAVCSGHLLRFVLGGKSLNLFVEVTLSNGCGEVPLPLHYHRNKHSNHDSDSRLCGHRLASIAACGNGNQNNQSNYNNHGNYNPDTHTFVQLAGMAWLSPFQMVWISRFI